jgi:uncharacterized peroxidase-related enzyme
VIRLDVIRRGRGLRAKAMGLVAPLVTGGPLPGFVRVLTFRPAFFGAPFGRYGQAVLRGPGRWSVGERELFGAAISDGNACGYCSGLHHRIAAECLGEPVADALVHRRTEAHDDVDPALAAMVGFLRRLSREPETLSPADVAALRAAGISDDAVREAAHAAALLEIANRVNTSLGVEAMDEKGNRRAAAMLLRRGYEL